MPLLKNDTYTVEDIYALPEGKRAELIDGQIYDMHLINGDKRIANDMRHHKSESYTATLSFDKDGKPVYISKFWE